MIIEPSSKQNNFGSRDVNMPCHYSKHVWAILIAMVMTGAARSVVVKLAYQKGFEVPLSITMIYLFGQALSLFVFWGQKHIIINFSGKNKRLKKMEIESKLKETQVNQVIDNTEPKQPRWHDNDTDIEETSSEEECNHVLIGSLHGLTEESERAIKWIHLIPYYAKPIIPSFFNLLNSLLRWASLLYIAASISEMLISGLELTLSVVAARIFRKRLVSRERWIGVLLVSIGVLIIGYIDYQSSTKEEILKDNGNQDYNINRSVIGISFIVASCVLSVLQDLSEEIFMQASEFPPTLLLGFEGLFGFVFGFILFYFFGKYVGEDFPFEAINLVKENSQNKVWIMGMPFLFLITGIFNIKATEVTSSMTRNVWKNLRSLMVWMVSLLIFYTNENSILGEEWRIPESLYICIGFFIMCVGVVIYYSQKQKESDKEKEEKTSENYLNQNASCEVPAINPPP